MNTKRSKQNSKPSSVAHYTSYETIKKILTDALSSGEITLQLTHLSEMNDASEESILNKYFTDSECKKERKKDFQKFYDDNTPFVFSTIRVDRLTCRQGSLPMWKTYGDNCKGALLKFDWKKLNDFCTGRKYFKPCEYKNTQEVSQIIKALNQQKNPTDSTFLEILQQSCFTKKIDWKEEKEWRILILSSNDNAKENDAHKKYIELSLPINFITTIQLGPLCKEENELPELIAELKRKFPEQTSLLKWSKSNIAIR